MFIKLLIFAIMVQNGFQQCAVGCLKCTSGNLCLVCDTPVGYFLSSTSNTCLKGTIDNCTILSQIGVCANCNEGYYLDGNTLKCVAIPTAKVITNCASYTNSLDCNFCKKDFRIQNAACVAVTTAVTNCLTYKSDGTCKTCNVNYTFALNGLDCVAIPTNIPNCVRYTFMNCRQCTDDAVNNPNNELANLNRRESSDHGKMYLPERSRTEKYMTKVLAQKS